MQAAIISVVVIAVLAVIYFTVGSLIAKKLFKPKRNSVEFTVEKQLKRGKLLPGDTDIPYVPFKRVSRYGYDLTAKLYKSDCNTEKRLLVWLHGYGGCNVNGIIQYKIYGKLGYDVFMPNHNYSGDSGGTGYTFGAREKEDVYDWIDAVLKDYDYAHIAIAGESMGAAIAILMAAEQKYDYEFVVADSSYAGVADVVGDRMGKDYPAFLRIFMPAFKVAAKVFFGCDVRKLSILRAIKNVHVPIYLTHSRTDATTPYASAERLTAARPDVEFHPYDDVAHCQAVIKYNEEYTSEIVRFVKAATSDEQPSKS